MARWSRLRLTVRPSWYSAERWKSRRSLPRYRLAARMTLVPGPGSASGTARSTRCTSASLPVLRMPSSVSTAAADVTSHGGRGSGPRSVGWVAGQVDQR